MDVYDEKCLARLVLQGNYSSATSLLSELHWLPVNKRINVKLATLVHQAHLSVFEHLISLSSPSTQLIIICYLCHAATAVSDKEVFPTMTLKSGTTYHLQFPSLVSFKHNLKTHYSANNWPPSECLQLLWFDTLDIVRSTNCYERTNEWMSEDMANSHCKAETINFSIFLWLFKIF